MQEEFISYIIILLITAFLLMLALKLKISYPIVLVLGGLALSFFTGKREAVIEPELIFLIFLPPLLYEAAWQTSWKDFWKWRRLIFSFAFLIVIVTSCVVAVVSHALIPGFTLALGFLLGGIVSPPDAISAASIMRDQDVPKRLLAIIGGESLLNDASSITIFRFAILAIVTGKFDFSVAAVDFLLVIALGCIIGVAVGMIFYAIHRWMPTNPSIDIFLTLITPYVMYVAAEHFHYSGVIAVVSGGLFLSNQRQVILTQESRIQGLNVWAVLSYVLNSVIFMLIGLQLPSIVAQLGSISLFSAIKYGLIISITLIVCRLLCTLGASAFTRVASRFIKTADSNPGWKMPVVFGWAGMRGVVSLAAALSIPVYLSKGVHFPQRNLILFITFMVILVTLIFQGLTLPWVIKKMNLEDKDYPLSEAEQELFIRKQLTMAALRKLNDDFATESAENFLIKNLKLRLQNELKYLRAETSDTQHSHQDHTVTEDSNRIHIAIIDLQREMLKEMNKEDKYDEDLIKRHLLLLDHEEVRLMNLHQVNQEN